VIVLGIDPGPETHGAVVYDTDARRVLWSAKAIESIDLETKVNTLHGAGLRPFRIVIERPAAMGVIGVGMAGHMLNTAWVAGRLAGVRGEVHAIKIETMTRREVLRHLGVLSGKGSSDSRVRAACIADHETPGGPPAVGRKASPGPLYGVSSHAWQALGLVLAWLEMTKHTETT